MLKFVKTHGASLGIIGLGIALLAGVILVARSMDLLGDTPDREVRNQRSDSLREERLATASLNARDAHGNNDWSYWGWGGSGHAGEGNTDEPAGLAARDALHRNLSGTTSLSSIPPRQRARARTLGVVLSELSRRQRLRRGHVGRNDPLGQEEPDEPEQEWASIRVYLTDFDEEPAEVRDIHDILGDPSNVVALDEDVYLLAWDVRNREPRGSYLSVLQNGADGRLEQVHRYYCGQRRLDVLAEICIPLGSVYSSEGVPAAVTYSDEGIPIPREADDLDPSAFSNRGRYIEANELLWWLQGHFTGEDRE